MGILRLSHVCLRAMDIDKSVDHYENILGLNSVHSDTDGRVYMKCWDEWDAYSLVLTPSDRAGLEYCAFKTEEDKDIDSLAGRIRDFGRECTIEPAGTMPFCGRSLHFLLPSGHEMRIISEKAETGTAVGNVNPDPWPDGLKGVGVHWLDHLAIVCELNPATGVNKVQENADFLQKVLDFKLTEQGLVGPGSDIMAAAFLTRSASPHDIACVGGPSAGLHHIAFHVEDWNAVLRAADIVAKTRGAPSLTPNRHGITRGVTFYLFDPSGNRNETFAGIGYRAHTDRPLVTWTEKELDRGLLYLGGADRSFVEIYT